MPMTDQELADLRELTKQNDPVAAVRMAIQDYIRYARLKKLSGRVEMQDNSRDLEDAELHHP